MTNINCLNTSYFHQFKGLFQPVRQNLHHSGSYNIRKNHKNLARKIDASRPRGKAFNRLWDIDGDYKLEHPECWN